MTTAICKRCSSSFPRPAGRKFYCSDLCRLLVKIDATGEGSCWTWTARLDRHGYGVFTIQNRKILAHRASYSLLRGPIPNGLILDHLCRTPACVNPDHLEAVTSRVNTLRGTGFAAINSAKTSCIRGHAFDEANTYRWRNARICRACRAQRGANQKAAA